jgi:glyoxylase I family protein
MFYVWRMDDQALWDAFCDSSLAEPVWHHESHLRIAFMHLARFELDEAHLRMRVGIIRLNAAHGLVETAERGYHETLTRLWLCLVDGARARSGSVDSTAFLAAQPELHDKQIVLRFYSRDRISSRQARACFMAPDLAPLPGINPGRSALRGSTHHVDLTVRDPWLSKSFYSAVLENLGYRLSREDERGIDFELQHPRGGFSSIGLVKATGDGADRQHDRYSPGLHHLAFCAATRDEVDGLHTLLQQIGAAVLDPPAEYPRYGEGYYAVFFADPDGLKLELVYEP